MSAPVHYDVEACIRAARKTFASMSVPADAPLAARIHKEHFEVAVMLLKMTLDSSNKRASLADVVDATTSIVVGHLVNLIACQPQSYQAALVARFLSKVDGTMTSVVSGNRGRTIAAATLDLPRVEGGHA